MPMLNLKCTKEIPEELMRQLSQAIANSIGKPEQYVMVAATKSDLMMGGKTGDAAYGEVKSIGGLNRVVNHDITMKICGLLYDHFGIPKDRIYVTFESLSSDHWGWNGRTFG